MDSDSRTAHDGRLIARARSDSEAFVRLYQMHYDLVFRYCAHRLFDRAAAEDVTSQVFLKVVEKFASFAGEERHFRNWLYRIATNAVNQHLRKIVRRNKLLEHAREQVHCCGSDCGQSAERVELLKEAMLALKPRYQTIITLRFFENLKPSEIAEVLDSSPGTVRSQMARALAKLRDRCVAAGQEI